MAIQWNVIKLPVSTSKDFTKIIAELDNREENGWDLEHVVQSDGAIIMFFKRRDE